MEKKVTREEFDSLAGQLRGLDLALMAVLTVLTPQQAAAISTLLRQHCADCANDPETPGSPTEQSRLYSVLDQICAGLDARQSRVSP